MSTTFGVIKSAMHETTLEVYSSLTAGEDGQGESCIRLWATQAGSGAGVKITLTEESYRELLLALEVAAAYVGWEV